MDKTRKMVIPFICLLIGIAAGGYLFSRSQPRPLVSLTPSRSPMNQKELAGLLASVGIQKLSGLIPGVVLETDKTIVLRHPFRKERVHYIIIPKKDIKNIGDISPADAPYLVDAHLVARKIIERERLFKYRLYTNGPGVQHVAYLHFHLVQK